MNKLFQPKESAINKDNVKARLNELRKIFAVTSFRVPMLGSLAFHMKRSVVRTPGFVAAASTDTLYFGEGFFKEEKQVQVWTVLHEILHVAFQHLNRRKQSGIVTQADHELSNIAEDLVINYALEELCKNKSLNIKRHEKALMFNQREFFPEMSAEDFAKLTVEKVRELLKEKQESQPKDSECDSGESSDKNSEGKPSSQSSSNKNPLSNDVQTNEQMEGDVLISDTGDINENGEAKDSASSEKESTSDQLEKWSQRLKQAATMASSTGTNILGMMIHDLPEVKTQWTDVIRSELIKAVNKNKNRVTWARPSRRTLARVTPYYQPGKLKIMGDPVIVVFFDVSGSCFSKQVLSIFTANLAALEKQCNCLITLFTFDTKLTKKYTVKNMQKVFHTLEWRGGGGTDFRPIFDDELLADGEEKPVLKKDIKAYLILTDLEGATPNSGPNVPVIWAGMKEDIGFTDRVPFGKSILMS